MSEDQRDFARFLWFRDPTVDFDELELIVLRFTKLVFGINVSPFLLNATLRHHISEYSKEDIEFATKLIKSLYVDDVNTGSNSVVQGFEFYKKAKTCLGSAMFNHGLFTNGWETERFEIRLWKILIGSASG